MRLLQGGRRQDPAGRFRAGRQAPGPGRIAEDFRFDQLPEDVDHFAPILEAAVQRLPILEPRASTFFNGPESFTPDDRYLLGEATELRHFYVAAGFNSAGIQSAGGAGAAGGMDGRRRAALRPVGRRHPAPAAVPEHARLSLRARRNPRPALRHFPYRQFAAAMCATRRSRAPGRARCRVRRGGGLGARQLFLPPEALAEAPIHAGHAKGSRHRRRPTAILGSAELVRLQRRRAQGGGAAACSTLVLRQVPRRGARRRAVLQRVSANDAAVAPVFVYTQWLNDRGGIEADLTVTRLSETALVVTGAVVGRRDRAWLERHLPEDAHCVVTEVTAGEAVLAAMGPEAARCCSARPRPTSPTRPFPRHAEIDIGWWSPRASSLLRRRAGLELDVPADMARHAFDVLMEAGGDVGPGVASLRPARAGPCRLEKAFRHFGHDIGDEDHVLEAGLASP